MISRTGDIIHGNLCLSSWQHGGLFGDWQVSQQISKQLDCGLATLFKTQYIKKRATNIPQVNNANVLET